MRDVRHGRNALNNRLGEIEKYLRYLDHLLPQEIINIRKNDVECKDTDFVAMYTKDRENET